MKKLLPLIGLLMAGITTRAQLTDFEKSNGKKTATYFEITGWYETLARSSTGIKLLEMGPTDAGYPLHLAVISGNGDFDTASWRRQNKAVILVNNGIHPGEPDGIDASMMLARDLVSGKKALPPNVIVAIIPVYNIGGCLNRNSYTRVNQNGPEAYGFRGNSQNLDLNRDFTKCDSREARTFATIFHFLKPDILIDNHVSDGADFQHTMTMITTQYNKLGDSTGNWLRGVFEPAIYRGMKQKGWQLIPYVDFANDDMEKGIHMFFDPPRYSSGYAALFNTFSFMAETHMLKPYAQRVKSTYDLMCTFIDSGSRHAPAITRLRKKAAMDQLARQTFPLSWQPDKKRYDSIEFMGYEKDYKQSAATGLQQMFYNHDKPLTKTVRYYNQFNPRKMIEAPRAYIIPQGWHAVIELLTLNNVKISRVEKDSMYTLGTYHISDYKSLAMPWEKHHKNYAVSVSYSRQPIQIFKGDHIVFLDQPSKRYIIEMLEPEGDDSFFAWNFFDAILQQKEGYSDYRWEELAAELLKKDPALQASLDAKKAAEPEFASNSPEILAYIYKNSPYFEKSYRRYPVYRIEY